MPSNRSTTIDGFRELKAQLEDLGAELGVKVLSAAGRKAFTRVLETARALVPVDTGVLRDSIKLTVKRPKYEGDPVIVGLRIIKLKGADSRAPKRPRGYGSAEWRWHFVELGTMFKGAQPFLRPALDSNANGVIDDLKASLTKGIARAVRKRARAAK